MKKSAHITGTGGYQPGEPIPTSRIQELVGDLIPEVAEGLSIEQRFWQIDIETGEHNENNSDMSYKAAVLALESCGVDPQQVELIIQATGTPDYPLPAVVNQVQMQFMEVGGDQREAIFQHPDAVVRFTMPPMPGGGRRTCSR